jgi:formiminoglutamase
MIGSDARLPLLISLPHAGFEVPPEAKPYCALRPRDILRDSDEGAADIYDIEPEVACFVSTPIARAIVDLNRSESDRSKDGVVKTHTCRDVPVYRPSPPEPVLRDLIARYHRPYHARLRELAKREVMLGIDCHTMAAKGPPAGSDLGAERPAVCVSHADGTCPQRYLRPLILCLSEAFAGFAVSVNHPIRGGHIIRCHAGELPWVRLEFSRGSFLPTHAKRERLLYALVRFCRTIA